MSFENVPDPSLAGGGSGGGSGGPGRDDQARASAAAANAENTRQNDVLTAIRTDVDAKAPLTAVQTLSDAVAGKASHADVEALTTVVAGKATHQELVDQAAGIALVNDAQTAAINGKADTATVNAALADKLATTAFTTFKTAQELKDQQHDTAIALKADQVAMTTALGAKLATTTFTTYTTANDLAISNLTTSVNSKADATATTNALATKATTSDLNAQTSRINAIAGSGNVGDGGILKTHTDAIAANVSAIALRATATDLAAQVARINTIIGADGNGGRLKQVEDTLSASGSLYWVGVTTMNVPVDFATIALALTAASARVPKDGATVEILVDQAQGAMSPGVGGRAGCWVEALPDLSGRNLAHVTIRPKTEPLDLVVSTSSNGIVSGGSGNYLVTWPMAGQDLSGIAVGDRVQFWGTAIATATNTFGEAVSYCGTYEVTAVDNTAKTLQIRTRNRRTALSATTRGDFRITVYPIRLTMGSVGGMVWNKARTPRFKHVCIVATVVATSAVLTVNDSYVQAWEPDIQAGVISYRPYLAIDGAASSSYLLLARFTNFKGGISASNNTAQVNGVELNCCEWDARSILVSAVGGGGLVTYGTRIRMPVIYITGDVQLLLTGTAFNGCYLSRDSDLMCGQNSVAGNVGADMAAGFNVRISFRFGIDINTSLSPQTYAPALNTVGNNNSYIAQG